MKIIDAHIHFYQNDEYFDQIALAAGHENTEEHLRKAFAENGVVRGVVMGNRDLALENHEYPDFLSYCIGLDSWYFSETGDGMKDAAVLVEQHLKRDNCVGIKLYPGYCSTYVSDPIYHPFYELAEAYGKPVAIHTGATAGNDGHLKYSHPLTIDDAAVEFPRVSFVMCHMGNPWVMDAAAVMDKNDNVSADLSGLLEGRLDVPAFFRENSGYIEYLRTWMNYVEAWDRLMYGTDWPLVNIPDYIRFIAELIPERYHELVFHENAERIYGKGLLSKMSTK